MKKLLSVSILALSLVACVDPASSNTVSDEANNKKQWSGAIPTLKSGDTPDSIVVYDADQNIIFQKDIRSNNELSGDFPDLNSESYPLQVILSDEDERSGYTLQEDTTQSNTVTLPFDNQNQVACIEIYAPVCVRETTYDNSCMAEAEGFNDWVEGACEGSQQVNFCPTIYEPVCADGKTYSNSCEALKNSDQEFVTGACEDNQQTVCPAIYAPVCADGNDYNNSCEADAAGFTHLLEGTCEELKCTPNGCQDSDGTTQPFDKDDQVACIEIYAPVCANETTYDNSCKAEAKGFNNWTTGTCKDLQQTVCPEIYDPVCVEGTTYSNSCEAQADNKTAWKKGACDNNLQCSASGACDDLKE
jgi:hypothetical protein